MSTDKTPPIDREAVRAMVRQVLRDAIPETVRKRIAAEVGKASAAPPPADVADARTEEVSLATDADVAAFVRRVLKLARDPKQREAMENGRLAFRLKGVRASEPARSSGGERIDKGLLTERGVIAAAKAGKRLVLGRRVVLTPLARDKARQLGVEIERE
jgi:hypothetical protein